MPEISQIVTVLGGNELRLINKLVLLLPTDSFFQPLLKVSMSMRDSLILVLRKAMFARYVVSRESLGNGTFWW